jgi:hypothetical protein
MLFGQKQPIITGAGDQRLIASPFQDRFHAQQQAPIVVDQQH